MNDQNNSDIQFNPADDAVFDGIIEGLFECSNGINLLHTPSIFEMT